MTTKPAPSLFRFAVGCFSAAFAVLGVYYLATRSPSLPPPPAPKAATPQAEAIPVTPPQTALPAAPAAPPQLAAQINALGRGFDGQVGIAVQAIDDGWVAEHNGARPFPQQSVSKLWVAATVMAKVDAGELSLLDTMPLTATDLTIFHQPIRKKILAGNYRPPLSELLTFAMTQSDNAANDALFRRVGGEAGVEGFLSSAGLSGITMAQSEIALQMGIAGTQWKPAFSYGRSFWQARNAIPWNRRKQAIDAYVANPPDGATPVAVAQGLTLLQRGELLSPRSTAYLIDLMTRSKTGPDRLKSGLAPGWTMAHKTGTGQVLQLLTNEHAGIFTAYNDVGILTSPTGRHYALVVMIGSTMRSVPQRQALMRAVTQTVIAYDQSRG
jgi:beta-lactamase class A